VTTKGARTRKAILEAAITRFGRDGYRSTSVADIARDAAVGPTATFAYFPNKEALFLAAVDEDAAAMIQETLSDANATSNTQEWRQAFFVGSVEALDRHPLARRLHAGLEPDFTGRVLDVPALAELRKAFAERLRTDQVGGKVRPDIDVVAIANGVVAISLSLLRSLVQLGDDATGTYAPDIAAVIEAAIDRVPTAPSGRQRLHAATKSSGRGPRRRNET
jgi:AcrR family transcriptional regulator